MTAFSDVLEARLSRRDWLRGAAALSLFAGLSACATRAPGTAPALTFTPIGPSDADDLRVPPEYEATVLFRWGDPVGAARHIRSAMKPDGTFMVVEPMAGDRMAENMHPMGQIFYGFSCIGCVPVSLSQEVGLGLGAQAGEKRLAEVLQQGGFSHVRRATQTHTNMVLEAKA